MAKPNTGYVFKDKYNRWFARTSYVDATGKRRNVKKCARDRAHAKEVLKKILRDLEDHGTKFVEAAQMTFNDLAKYYEENYLLEAEYIGDRKVAGLRSKYDIEFRLGIIKEYFGKFKIRELTHKNNCSLNFAALASATGSLCTSSCCARLATRRRRSPRSCSVRAQASIAPSGLIRLTPSRL